MNPPARAVAEPVEHGVRVNGIQLTYFERGVEHRGAKPTLLFVHATGFHARIWDQIANRLAGFHIVAVDQRGHGRSEKRLIAHWDEVVTDLTALVDTLDLQRIIGIGHSMGAHALIGAAARSSARFLRLVAIDPVIGSPDVYRSGRSSSHEVDVHPTARRRNEFASPQEMAERLLGKGSFARFNPAMLSDYCTYGLLPNPAGAGFVLACPPEVEASVYMTNWSNGAIYDAVRSLDIPVLILRAQEPPQDRTVMDFSASPTWPALVYEFKLGREIYYPDRTHFIPMEIPDEVAQLIQAEAAAETR